MKTIRITTVTVLALAALVAAGCSSTRSVGEQVDDATITSKIKTKLAGDPEVNPFNIDVDTLDGVVTLSGEVRDPEARREAEELAWATRGVRDVVNEIRVVG